MMCLMIPPRSLYHLPIWYNKTSLCISCIPHFIIHNKWKYKTSWCGCSIYKNYLKSISCNHMIACVPWLFRIYVLWNEQVVWRDCVALLEQGQSVWQLHGRYVYLEEVQFSYLLVLWEPIGQMWLLHHLKRKNKYQKNARKRSAQIKCYMKL